MKRKITLCLFVLLLIISLTGCDTQKEENNNNTNNNSQEQQNMSKKEENIQNNSVIIGDEIIEFDDEDNVPIEEEVVVEKVINCDGCVYSYFSEVKTIGSALSPNEYTTDITKLKTKGGKQRHNFFGFVLSKNIISKAYSCVLKDNKIYCIQGSVDGSYFSNNIGILNQIFTSNQCKYLSNGHTYWCEGGDYTGDTQTSGYTSLHYETSCTIYGADARTGELICH